MYFEAKIQNQIYEVNVSESKDAWLVNFRKKDEAWTYLTISKEDYQTLDNITSFIYKNSSYLIDTVGVGTEYTVYTRGAYRSVEIYNEEKLLHESLKSGAGLAAGNSLNAGMPGKIVKVMVQEGQEVAEGDPLLIMEAMKMENEMRATKACIVDQIFVNEGDNVEGNAQLMSFR